MPSRPRKRVRKRKPKRYERLRKQMTQGPLGDVLGETKFEIDPEGQDKMSEVMLEFVAPYLESLETEEEYSKLFMVALVAWNASFLPRKKRKELVDKVLAAGIRTGEAREGVKAIVDALIARKDAHFSQYKRTIVAFDVKGDGDAFHVSVASTEGPWNPRG